MALRLPEQDLRAAEVGEGIGSREAEETRAVQWVGPSPSRLTFPGNWGHQPGWGEAGVHAINCTFVFLSAKNKG